MKFLILLLLAIITFSNCQYETTTPYPVTEEVKVLVKNYEAKIKELLAAKNFDGLSKYIAEWLMLDFNGVEGNKRQDLINHLKNGTFVMFDGIVPNSVPYINNVRDFRIYVYLDQTNGKKTVYGLEQTKENEFGYSLIYYRTNM